MINLYKESKRAWTADVLKCTWHFPLSYNSFSVACLLFWPVKSPGMSVRASWKPLQQQPAPLLGFLPSAGMCDSLPAPLPQTSAGSWNSAVLICDGILVVGFLSRVVCESGSWVGSITKPHSLQNTGYPVCFGLFSADIWCCHDCDDNRTEGKWSSILTFVLDGDVSAVSHVLLRWLCLIYSHIFYNFVLFSSWNVFEFRLHEHRLITPEITQTFWQGGSVQGANCQLRSSPVMSQLRHCQ